MKNGNPSERINFTKKSLEELKPNGKDTFYYDTKERGLYLMVRAKGTKSFGYRGRLYGMQKTFKIGRFPDYSVENARKKVSDYKSDLGKGINPIEERIRIVNDITFGEMAKDFVENYGKLEKKSWRDDEAAVKNHLSHWLNKKAYLITAKDVESTVKAYGSKGHRIGSNRLLEKIKAIFNRAISLGWKGQNPTKGIKKYAEQSRERILKLDEFPNFFRALEAEYNITVKDFVLVALFTGIRKTNVLEMKWDDLKLDSQMPTWTIKETKNGDSNTVILPPIIIELLKSRRKLSEIEESPFVFPGEGAKGHFSDPKKAWGRILKNAGINELRIHDLRRTVATVMSDKGVNEVTIQNVLGHRTKSLLRVYSRTTEEAKLKALTEASEFMISKAEGINKWWH